MPSSDLTIQVVVNLLLVALGYLIVRLGLLSRHDGRVLNRLVLYVTLPATSLRAMAGATLEPRILALPVLLFLLSMAMWLLGTLPARALRLTRADYGTFVVSLSGFMASLAYPFAETAFGIEGVRALAISDLGNALAILGVAYYLSFRYAEQGRFRPAEVFRKMIAFPPLHAFWIALLLQAVRLQPAGVLGALLEALARVNSPLMLLSLGMYIELDLARDEARTLAVHTAFKYGLGALLALALALALPYRGPERAIAFLVPLMPPPLSTLLYSVEQGLNARLAAKFVSLGIIVSLVLATIAVLGFRSAF
jgi:predicted permease